MLQYFSVSEFISETCDIVIENLWHEFYKLYEVLRKSSYSEEEILKFKKNVKDWIRTFCQLTILGQMNSTIAISSLYRKCYTIYAYVYNVCALFYASIKRNWSFN